MASREDYIVEFARAIAPGYPELLLSTSTEKSILTEATKLINHLRDALTNAEKERDRLKERIYQSIKILRELAENAGSWDDQEVRDTVDGVIDGLESEVLRTGGRG